MSKPISSFPPEERYKVALRRKASETKGLGYWSAVNYLARQGLVKRFLNKK